MTKGRLDVVHICRVQVDHYTRQWWLQGEVDKIFMIKTGQSLKKALGLYRKKAEIDRIALAYKYRGVCSPGEAAMTLSAVVGEVVKKEGKD